MWRFWAARARQFQHAAVTSQDLGLNRPWVTEFWNPIVEVSLDLLDRRRLNHAEVVAAIRRSAVGPHIVPLPSGEAASWRPKAAICSRSGATVARATSEVSARPTAGCKSVETADSVWPATDRALMDFIGRLRD
jgi:hypothetical protein